MSQVLGRQSAAQVRITFLGFTSLAKNLYLVAAGFIFLLFVATTLFKVIKDSINQLWNVKGDPNQPFKLKMEKTENRNGVLLYIATKHKELALFGDEGIYKATGADYWDGAVKNMISHFNGDDICEGMVQCIKQVGETLKEKFPYDKTEDKNELPDEIVFGN